MVNTRRGSGVPTGVDLERIASARVGRLATVRPDGRPHVVPVTFALSGDALVTAVDSKPKRTTELQRLRNVREHPAACLVVDHYDDDWSLLWWVRIDGTAEVVEASAAAEDIDALVAKYAQYRSARPRGPVLRLRVDQWTSWSAAGD
jgi:PPOX class probable F420-dependent enzyme